MFVSCGRVERRFHYPYNDDKQDDKRLKEKMFCEILLNVDRVFANEWLDLKVIFTKVTTWQ